MSATPIPTPGFPPVDGPTPLSQTEMRALAESLPVTPFFTITYSGLRLGTHRAFVAGTLDDPDAVIVQHAGVPGEPEFFGRDPEAGWSLLSRIPGWFCLCGSESSMAQFAPIFAREVPHPFRRLGDLFYTLDGPPRRYEHPAVRRLGLADVPLLAQADPDVRGGGYTTFEEMLTKGVVAAGIVDGRVVALVMSSADEGSYADVGVNTLEPWRRQGMSSAGVSLVAEAVVARGQIPIWSTGQHNVASQRVAEKVGFRFYGRGEYLVFDSLKETGGFRPR